MQNTHAIFVHISIQILSHAPTPKKGLCFVIAWKLVIFYVSGGIIPGYSLSPKETRLCKVAERGDLYGSQGLM